MTAPRLLSTLIAVVLMAFPATVLAQDGGDGSDDGVTHQQGPGSKEYAIPYESQRTQAAPVKKPAHKPAASKPAPAQPVAATPAPTYSAPTPQPATATRQTQTRGKAVKRHAAKTRKHQPSGASTAKPVPTARIATPVAATSSDSGSPALLIAAIVAGTLLLGAGAGVALRRRGSGRLQGETTPS